MKKIKQITTLLALILLTHSVIAQGGFKREYNLPGALNNSSKAVFETTPGNYIMTGISVDTIGGFQTNRLTLFGIDQYGYKTWTKKYGNINFEYLDNPFIVKWFYKYGNNLYHAGSVRDSNNKYLGVFVKFDFSGDTLWQKRFYDNNYHVYPQMVTRSTDGGFLIIGFLEDFINPNRLVLLIKTGADGNELWRKYIPKSGQNAHDGKVLIQDSATKKIVIAGYQYINNQLKDNIIVTDSLGNVLSQHTLVGSSLGAWLFDLIQTSDKKFIAVGNAIYPQTIGNTNLTHSYAVKFDINNPGNPIWKMNNFDKLTLGNSFGSIQELPDHNLMLAGTIDTMLMNNFPRQCVHRLTKMDPNGNMIWNKYYNYSKSSSVANNESMMQIQRTSDGSFAAAIQIVNNSPNYFFFVKYDSTGCDSSVSYCQSVGIKEIMRYWNISVYPKPCKDFLHVKIQSQEKFSFKITNLLGAAVLIPETELKEEECLLNLQSLNSGIYFLNIYRASTLIASEKIIKD